MVLVVVETNYFVLFSYLGKVVEVRVSSSFRTFVVDENVCTSKKNSDDENVCTSKKIQIEVVVE